MRHECLRGYPVRVTVISEQKERGGCRVDSKADRFNRLAIKCGGSRVMRGSGAVRQTADNCGLAGNMREITVI